MGDGLDRICLLISSWLNLPANNPPYPPCREGALLALQAGPSRIPPPFAGVSLAEAESICECIMGSMELTLTLDPKDGRDPIAVMIRLEKPILRPLKWRGGPGLEFIPAPICREVDTDWSYGIEKAIQQIGRSELASRPSLESVE